MRKKLPTVVACSMLLSACAFGQSINYGGVMPTSHLRGSGPLVVAVHDRRREVVSGGKQPAFCGVFRGGFYNPFDVETAGAVPLADEFNAAVMRAVSRAGFTVTSVRTAAHQSDQQVATFLSGKLALLIEIAKWRSDTYNRTDLVYDVAARVIDQAGRELGKAHIAGTDALGGNLFDPGAHAKAAVPAAFRVQLERLLNHPSIRQALQSAAPTAAVALMSARI